MAVFKFGIRPALYTAESENDMLKISKTRQTDAAVEYKLDGSLSGVWVDELRRICDAAFASDLSLVLDLSNLRFVDSEGAALLQRLSERHVTQLNSSAFVRAHVQGGM